MRETYQMLTANIVNFALKHGNDTAYKVVRFGVQKDALFYTYQDLVKNEPSFMPIEKIPQEVKEKYWDLSAEYSDFVEKRKEICCCFCLIDFLMKNV